MIHFSALPRPVLPSVPLFGSQRKSARPSQNRADKATDPSPANTGPINVKQILASMPQEDRQALEAFFRKNSLGAHCLLYPLFSPTKPVARMYGSMMDPNLHDPTWKEYQVWQKYQDKFPSSNIALLTLPGDDDSFFNFIAINKQAALNLLRKHLPGLQKVLNENVTAETLLERILKPEGHENNPFILNNETMTGLMYGFGFDASRAADREDELEGRSRTRLPLNPSIKPSPGFDTIQEELAYLKEQFVNVGDIDTEESIGKVASISYAGLRNNKETQELATHYRKILPKLQAIYDSPHFLEKVLTQLVNSGTENEIKLDTTV